MLIVQHYSETKEYVLNLLCRFKKPIDIDNEYATETLRQKQNKDKKLLPLKSRYYQIFYKKAVTQNVDLHWSCSLSRKCSRKKISY